MVQVGPKQRLSWFVEDCWRADVLTDTHDPTEPMFSAVYIRLAPRISNLSVTMSKPAGFYTRRCVSEPMYKTVDNVDSLGVRMATLEVRYAVISKGRFPARNL